MSQENLVLYRKYRPKTFSEVVGQDHVIRTITNALATNRVAHAYLFTGARGTGKTTVARLLSKAVNCECASPPSHSRVLSCHSRENDGNPENKNDILRFEPCNKCSACKEINSGQSFDLIEIDAASNRGIDEMRKLRDGIKFTPARLRKKVFIIDEVHMLTPPAFNALLKTLEEPPTYALFILATTELHKVPQTIISRCQKFDFRKLPLDKIADRLSLISKKEKVKIEKTALNLIAINADGCVRDAESLLGQIMAVQDKEITLQEVQDILGVTNITAVQDFIGLLADKQHAQAINHINNIMNNGYDLSQFSKSLISYLRKMMILKVDNNLAKLVAPELTDQQLNGIISQGSKFHNNELVRLIHLFIDADNDIKTSDLPQLPLELVVVESQCYCEGEARSNLVAETIN